MVALSSVRKRNTHKLFSGENDGGATAHGEKAKYSQTL
jgi:hypothetical protein